MLSAKQISQAKEIGRQWGEIEVSVWKDMNEKPLPEWVYGNYCGPRPDDLTDEQWEEYEDWIEESAKEVWDKNR